VLQAGLIDFLEFFLSKGLFVDQQDRDGFTPLFCAVHSCRLEVAEYLLAKGSGVKLSGKVIDLFVISPSLSLGLRSVCLSSVGYHVLVCSPLASQNGRTILHSLAQLPASDQWLRIVTAVIKAGASIEVAHPPTRSSPLQLINSHRRPTRPGTAPCILPLTAATTRVYLRCCRLARSPTLPIATGTLPCTAPPPWLPRGRTSRRMSKISLRFLNSSITRGLVGLYTEAKVASAGRSR
jgi:hypothetical protein